MKTVPRKRWITIGEAERAYVKIGNCGYPFGIRMHWRGDVAWCQPCEFLGWANVLCAIRTRLRLAGLQAECFEGALGWDVPTGTKVAVKVLVSRSRAGAKPG